jgi:hypothetical protein
MTVIWKCLWFHVSAAVLMRSALFCSITQCWMVILYCVLVQHITPIFKRQEVPWRWDRYVVPKYWLRITTWCRITPKKSAVLKVPNLYFVKNILRDDLKHTKMKCQHKSQKNQGSLFNSHPDKTTGVPNFSIFLTLTIKSVHVILWPLIHIRLYILLPSGKLACWEADSSSGFCNGYNPSTTIPRQLFQAILDACLVLVLRQIWDYYLHRLIIWLQTKGIQESGLLARKDRWDATHGRIIKPYLDMLGKVLTDNTNKYTIKKLKVTIWCKEKKNVNIRFICIPHTGFMTYLLWKYKWLS